MATSPTATPTQPARGAPKVDFVTDEELEKDWKPNGRRPQSYVVLPSAAQAQGIVGAQ